MSHIWPGQHWPASPAQEEALIADLRSRVAKPGKFDRDDVTAIVGMLRCGSSLDRALELAPGLNLAALLGGYETLHRELRRSRNAWLAIVRNPRPSTLVEHADVAARMLPVPVARALFAMEDSPELLPALVEDMAAAVADCLMAAHAIEERLETYDPPSPTGVSIGAKLYSAHEPGVYSDPFYLADRVAALSPVRINDLLGGPRA